MIRRLDSSGRVGGRWNAGPPRARPVTVEGLLRRLVFLGMLFSLTPAHAVLSGPEWEAKASRNPDLAAAATAVEEENWNEAVSLLTRVIERRPWDDDAFTLLGYAYRKLGDYRQSLKHYHRALDLNPYHLGALEYLGEAYVETGDLERARELLNRIEATCRRTRGDEQWRDHCEEWRELAERLEGAR